MKLIAATALAVLLAFPAMASNCAPRETVLNQLTEKYRETRHAMGMIQQRSVMELFASDETGTWTITVTHPNGLTCMVASGQSYEALSEALPTGDPA